MLVLARKLGEKVVIPQLDITISIQKICGRQIWLGIDAPRSIAVHREETLQKKALFAMKG